MRDRSSYRSISHRNGLHAIETRLKETDIHIQFPDSCRDIVTKSMVSSWIIEARSAIEDYASAHPEFMISEAPLKHAGIAPSIIRTMLNAGSIAGTGPMAAVAGAIAEHVGNHCVTLCKGEVIVENGGDIFCHVTSPVTISLWAGDSPLSGRVGIVPREMPGTFGICTSSGTVGHSKSYGNADAVTVLSRSTAVADAVATMACNIIKTPEDIEKAINYASSRDGVEGMVAIINDRLGAWGKLELVAI